MKVSDATLRCHRSHMWGQLTACILILEPALSQSIPRDNLPVTMQTSVVSESDVRSRVHSPGERQSLMSGGRAGARGVCSPAHCARIKH